MTVDVRRIRRALQESVDCWEDRLRALNRARGGFGTTNQGEFSRIAAIRAEFRLKPYEEIP